MSNNLNLTQMTVGQTNKETTHNDSNGEIDASVTEDLEVSVASGNATIADADYRRNVFFLITGATASPAITRTVTLPAIKRMVAFKSAAANFNTVTLSYGSPAQTINLNPGEVVIVYTDGTATGLFAVTTPTTGEVASVYDFGFSVLGTPSSATLGRVVIGRDVLVLADMSGSSGDVGTNPSATYAIDVRDDGVSIGTISISTGGAFTFTTTSGTSKNIAAGSVVEFVRTASPDITVSDVAAVILATLS